MASDDVRNFMGYLWIRQEDGVITIGINEDGLEDFEEISSVELPAEQEKIDADVVIGTLETDDGPLDIYSPVSGTVIEVNTQVIEDPSLIVEDPYEEGWLIRVEADEDYDDEDEDEEDDDDDDDEDEDDYEDDED
ncbi:MAG: glycine cleavage system protein H-like protein [Bdellovibrio sp. ArHS]|uniref:glycine cleavage system protein H n=1 Tax=Bdellovibrio sp. ArHS TaxID=1569284 RepID=UPI000583426F|nr:glycine cleavage system protein H [Bdellovibrio sp. ArHS]KHD87403.1 MAG: glycine cleavage system protein H-like protein [Bdellovibrio sp. ArHS]